MKARFVGLLILMLFGYAHAGDRGESGSSRVENATPYSLTDCHSAKNRCSSRCDDGQCTACCNVTWGFCVLDNEGDLPSGYLGAQLQTCVGDFINQQKDSLNDGRASPGRGSSLGDKTEDKVEEYLPCSAGFFEDQNTLSNMLTPHLGIDWQSTITGAAASSCLQTSFASCATARAKTWPEKQNACCMMEACSNNIYNEIYVKEFQDCLAAAADPITGYATCEITVKAKAVNAATACQQLAPDCVN